MHFSVANLSIFTTVIFTLMIPSSALNITQEACSSASAQVATKYPNKCHIAKVFDTFSEGNFTAFFGHVAPNVNWALMGTHPLAGAYSNRTIFATDALVRLSATLDPKCPTSLNTVNVFGGGDEEWSSQELHALGVCKIGEAFVF